MKWIHGEAAYDAKALMVERASENLAEGRCCDEARCLARSEIAFEVESEGRCFTASFCGRHAVEFAATGFPGWRLGKPRKLEHDEVLHGLLADDEDQDKDNDQGPETPTG